MQPHFEVAFTLKIWEELCSKIFIAMKFSLISFLLEYCTLNRKPYNLTKLNAQIREQNNHNYSSQFSWTCKYSDLYGMRGKGMCFGCSATQILKESVV